MKKGRHRMYKKIIVALVITIFLLVGYFFYRREFIDCAGCGNCNYEKKSLKAYISYSEIENDTVKFVSFKPLTAQKSWAWKGHEKTWVWLDKYRMDFLGIKFSPDNIADTTIIYLISGSFIVEGTCSPARISKINRVQE